MRVSYAGAEVARHAERHGRHERAISLGHLTGIASRRLIAGAPPSPELLRPLSEYERAIGGGF
jgi:hypothetical protein